MRSPDSVSLIDRFGIRRKCECSVFFGKMAHGIWRDAVRVSEVSTRTHTNAHVNARSTANSHPHPRAHTHSHT